MVAIKEDAIAYLLSSNLPCTGQICTCFCGATLNRQHTFGVALWRKKKKKTQKVFNLSPKRRGDLLQMHGSFSSTKMDSALEPLMVGESTHRALAWT